MGTTEGRQVEINPAADIVIQIYAIARSRRLRRSALRDRTRSPPVPTTTPSNLVFQHRSHRYGDGDCRIRVPHPVEPAESILCDLVRSSGMIRISSFESSNLV
jgi:hypothetical protein